jgi:VanZ family protein
MRAAFALCVVFMLYLTLYPWTIQESPRGFTLGGLRTRADWVDVALNLYFFIPFGFLGRRAGWRALHVVIGAALFSFGVECAQMYLPHRSAAVRDVATNTLGAALGVAFAEMRWAPRMPGGFRFALPAGGGAAMALLILWGLAQWFPLVPLPRLSVWTRFLAAQWWNGGWVMAVSGAVTALLAALLARQVWGRREALLFTGLVFALAPARIFVWGQQAAPGDILVVQAGLAAGAFLIWQEKLPGVSWLAALSVALIALRQLQPFEWAGADYHPANWVPFTAVMAFSRDGMIRMLAEKTFLSGGGVYWAARALGQPEWKTALPLAGFVLLAEAGQQYQAGRTPESTDAVLCLLAGAGLSVFTRRGGAR